MGRYFATAALAVDANQNPTSGLLGHPGTAVSANPAPKPSPPLTTPKKPRKPRTTVTAPYYNPENISVNDLTSENEGEIKREGGKSFLQIEKKRKIKISANSKTNKSN